VVEENLRMKNLKITIILFLLCTHFGDLNAQQWNWSKAIGGTELDNNSCIHTDSQGNVIAASYGQGDFAISAQNYYSPGTWAVISSYSSSGTLNWQKVIIADSINYSVKVQAISCDENNFVYVSGNYIGEIEFAPGFTLNSNSTGTNAFLAKLDTNGNFIWVQNYGQSTNSESAPGLEYYGNGRLFMLVTRSASSRLLKYDANGTLLNTYIPTLIGGGNSFYMNALRFKNNKVYICGAGFGQADFGNNVIIGSPGSSYSFILCCDTSGAGLWSKTYLSQSTSQFLDLDVNDNGEIMAGGNFQNIVFVDNDTLQTAGTYDGFMILIDSLGNTITKRRFGAGSDDNLYGVAAAQNGKWYVSGSFYTNAFSTTNLFGINMTSSNTDIFIARLNNGGLAEWVKKGNNSQADQCRSFGYDSINQHIYSGGYFQGTSTWGSNPISSVGSFDAFFAQLSDTTTFLTPYERPNLLLDSTSGVTCFGLCNGYYSSTFYSSYPPLQIALNGALISSQDLFSLCPTNILFP